MQSVNVKECDNLKQDVEGLKEIAASNPPPPIRSTFECPQSFCFHWEENDWARRLLHGLWKLLPTAKVYYSAEMRLRWATNLLYCLGVGDISHKYIFLFGGAPDVIINHKGIMVGGKRDEDDYYSTSEDEVVENSLQRPALRAVQAVAFFSLKK